MKRYEKSAFVRFFTLFISAFMLMYVLLAALYYMQEYQRLSKELELTNQMRYIECMKLKIESQCPLHSNQKPDMQKVHHDLGYLLLFVLLLFVPISIGLSLFSIKPVRKASEMIDHFISSIVHDINTPLTTIMLNVKSLIRKAQVPSQKLQYILSSSNQLLGMQHDLLALVDEKENIEREELALDKVMEEITESLKLQHKKQVFDITAEKLVVLVNHIDMYRILQNLLSNAVKYNRDNHPIQIDINNKRVTIKDKGIGMKNANRAFEKHYRENYHTEGNGIGLASVKSMAERNHIDISIHSKINEGTTVVLNFG